MYDHTVVRERFMSSLLAVRVRLWLDRRRQSRRDREWLKDATLTDIQSELNARRTQWARAQAAKNDPIYPDEAA